ncbi:MAG: insulinase family protein, partial [Candidatus Competibacteraceae bacterium]|nr:insulinase family protein [Candidatus Competibacteraceae bacterium]
SLDIVKKIVGQFHKEGISAAELAKEKSHLAGAYLVGLRSPRALARKISEYEQLGLPLKNLDNFPARLSRVTLNDVNQAIRKHFDVNSLRLPCPEL